jgi:hypothetical protein
MKKSLFKIAKYTLATAILAVFLYSCANPLVDSSLSSVSGNSKALVYPSIVEDSNYKGVLQLKSETVDTLKIDREPYLGEVVGGVIEITNLYYKGSEVIGFDFVSSKPVLAVYVKASNGGNLYDYRPTGVTSDTELYTPTNSSGTNAGISHVDFAWLVSGDDPMVPFETISGFVFYDANNNGVKDFGEPALPNVNVTLDKDGTPVTVPSAVDGSYSFTNLLSKSYAVTVGDLEGFVYSSPVVQNPLATAENVNFGFFVDYSWLNGKTANGFTIGYWKNNVDKAIANRTNGIQVSKSTLLGYLGTLSSFALSSLNFPATVDGLKSASAVLSKAGSVPTDLLAKQLSASEFNYASGAYIGGNALATSFFLFQGEYMLLNASSFTSSELLVQKDLYDAYNNSHGGAVQF